MDTTKVEPAVPADATAADEDQPIGTRAELAAVIRGLVDELGRNGNRWENATLPRYLEAMGRWIDDMDGYYAGRGETVPEQPTWQTVADILRAAAAYE